MKRCIWCKTLNEGGTEEHIFPEAIGCPPEFVFVDGTVCGKCNNGFGYIDKAVIDQFDVFTFENGVKRKKNKKPSIRSRGNFIGGYKDGEKYYFINTGKESAVDLLGNHVAPYRGKERDIKASLEVDGNMGKISFDIALTNRKNFRRGITKIAFSSLAYFLGGEVALQDRYDPIRSYVKKGNGERPILWYISDDTSFRNQVWSPYSRDGEFSITLRLAVYEFMVDLSPELIFIDELKEKAKEIYENGRTGCLPINA